LRVRYNIERESIDPRDLMSKLESVVDTSVADSIENTCVKRLAGDTEAQTSNPLEWGNSKEIEA
jgi:hypothetical protein